jgi:hypothetical protein
MMPADLIYALSDDSQRARLNRARAERSALRERRHGSRRRRTAQPFS